MLFIRYLSRSSSSASYCFLIVSFRVVYIALIPSRSHSHDLRSSSRRARNNITPSLNEFWTSFIDWKYLFLLINILKYAKICNKFEMVWLDPKAKIPTVIARSSRFPPTLYAVSRSIQCDFASAEVSRKHFIHKSVFFLVQNMVKTSPWSWHCKKSLTQNVKCMTRMSKLKYKYFDSSWMTKSLERINLVFDLLIVIFFSKMNLV